MVVWLATGGSSSRAYAKVVNQLRNARTMTYTMLTQSKTMPNIQMRIEFKEPGYLRYAMTPGVVGIFDLVQKKGITYITGKKEFIEVDGSGWSAAMPHLNLIEEMRSLPERASEILGKKEIDGRTVQGFRVTEEGMDKTVWVDTKTGELVRLEGKFRNAPNANVVMTDFQFNIELDDSRFSLNPPEGYRRAALPVTFRDPNEQDLIHVLRWWAIHNEAGLFPPTLDLVQFGFAASKMAKPDETEAQRIQDSLRGAQGLMFVARMKSENDWHYAGKDVKLGAADTPIAWWKPEGAKTYRVIFGDLRVQDMAPEDLPVSLDTENHE